MTLPLIRWSLQIGFTVDPPAPRDCIDEVTTAQAISIGFTSDLEDK